MHVISTVHDLTLNDKKIKEVTISHPSLSGYLKILAAASMVATRDVDSRATVQSERIKQQCKFVDDGGGQHTLDYVQLANLPIKLAKEIIENLEEERHDEAKLLSPDKADGISIPILVKLGKPLATGSGKAIEELEFLAKVYGDLEQVLVGDNDMDQAAALIRTVGKPPGMSALPSWAYDQITWQDAVFIRNNVLTRFLE